MIALCCLPFIIVHLFFILSWRKTAKMIPAEFHIFPRWFAWLMLIPGVGYVFEWMLLPFSLPGAIEKYQPENALLQQHRKKLFGLGLAYVILIALAIPFGVLILGFIPAIVLFILYWVAVVKIRKHFTQTLEA